jgi:hypothetical protein
MAAEKAAIPFKKRDAETAVVNVKPNNTKRGEKIKPPPSPTMVKIKDEQNMTGKSSVKDMAGELPCLSLKFAR